MIGPGEKVRTDFVFNASQKDYQGMKQNCMIARQVGYNWKAREGKRQRALGWWGRRKTMSISENNQAMAQEQRQVTDAGSWHGAAVMAAQTVASRRPCPLLSQQLPFLPDYYSFLPVAYDENEEEAALSR